MIPVRMPTILTSALPCREGTVLQAKLEDLAGLIGKFGLGAALFSFFAMAGTYSWEKFVVDGLSWDWSFASDYLHFVIIAITILVRLRGVAVFSGQCFAGLDSLSGFLFVAASWLPMLSTHPVWCSSWRGCL